MIALAATKSKSGKISKSFILTPSQGHDMSVQCEQSLDEQSKFVYWNTTQTLNIAYYI